MQKNSFGLALAILASLLFTVGGEAQAGEIIFADDIKQNVVTKEVLVRAADNVIVLVDSSSSMGETDKNRSKTNYQLETEALKAGFQRVPDLGYNIGVYRFTPWEAVYPIQKADPAVVAEALNKLPDKPAGPTPLLQSLEELEKVLKGLSGRTFVYLFSDGAFEITTREGRHWTIEEFLELLAAPASRRGGPERVEREVRKVMDAELFEDDFSLLITDFH